MKKFAAVNPDGRVSYTAQPSDDSQYTDGQCVGEMTMREFPIELSDTEVLNSKFYDNGWHDITECPAILNGSTLGFLPMPCLIIIDGTQYPCEDDNAEITFQYPGVHTITVKAARYREKTFTVTV